MPNIPTDQVESSPSMNGQEPSTVAEPDPYEPQTLITNAMADVNVEAVLTAVPVRKPKRTEFVRVHPSADYMVPCMLLMERDTGSDTETYLVTPPVQRLWGYRPYVPGGPVFRKLGAHTWLATGGRKMGTILAASFARRLVEEELRGRLA